ncbi:hypothetical protein [Phenylobacterium sp.]|uniref:hypothetical protein n=1 Tax=Phenylobacterium sp. TaxID=1871053 RepID=UPI001210C8E7|nr:hypothetical protein [Phenylobacterium sp.]THD64696.1 MAG: hypothetical protein E8A49_01205 [Phenylobacterium sp.]
MTSMRSRLTPLLGLSALAGVLILFSLTVRFTDYRPPVLVWPVIGVGWIAAVTWALLLYWRRLDEAAQEAQKSAWLWGGSFGMAAGWLADAAMSLPGVYPSVRHVVLSLGGALIVGGGLVAVGAAAGFLIAWAIWWGARR